MLRICLLAVIVAICGGAPVDKVASELNLLGSRLIAQNASETRAHDTIIIEEATLIKNWPTDQIVDYLGQISGLSFCPKGFLYIFHRADREMNERSFDNNNRYARINEDPIKDSTILKMNNKINEPDIIDELGDNLFFLPHGIFADKKYLWTTDLALHQVLRFPHGSKKPDLVLGERFIPGNDDTHFCKPTHAVTASDGSLFVADGYCNSRVVKFDQSGKFVMQFGDQAGPEQLSLPHHLVLIESKDMICVADRENSRVQCYNAGIKDGQRTGKLEKVIADAKFGPVYAIGYNSLSNTLYIVSGLTNGAEKSRVFLFNWDTGFITGSIDYPSPNGFGMAHTISVCPRQRCLAIGSLTKECPADTETCLDRADDDQNYQPRNVWLYGLSDEDVELE